MIRKTKQISDTLVDHLPNLHVQIVTTDDNTRALRPNYMYVWDRDSSCNFMYLSEVGQSLVDTFAWMLKKRGLKILLEAHTELLCDHLVPDLTTIAGRRYHRLLCGDLLLPKYVRCYDNDKTLDRYTVVFSGPASKGWYVGMSDDPFSPQGFGQHGEGRNGRSIDVNDSGWAPAIGRSTHLGKRINFLDLPPPCQKLVLSDYFNLYDL